LRRLHSALKAILGFFNPDWNSTQLSFWLAYWLSVLIRDSQFSMARKSLFINLHKV